jgi:hypothetical protein
MDEFSEYELYILNKLAVHSWWCNKHVSRDDLIKGRLKSDSHLYKEAIDILVKNKIVSQYKSQSRNDICLPKGHRDLVINTLKNNVGKYDFIDPTYFKRIK